VIRKKARSPPEDTASTAAVATEEAQSPLEDMAAKMAPSMEATTAAVATEEAQSPLGNQASLAAGTLPVESWASLVVDIMIHPVASLQGLL